MLLICSIVLLSFSWPSKLEKKVNDTIMKTFSIEKFGLEPIVVDQNIEEETTLTINDHLYRIKTDGASRGYVYVGEAPSMKNVFDYAVVLSEDLEILNAKVLIYREKHGRQIGMKRWLKQFFGMDTKDRPELGVDIDGISGATISATSMTKTVSQMLSSLEHLNNNGKL